MSNQLKKISGSQSLWFVTLITGCGPSANINCKDAALFHRFVEAPKELCQKKREKEIGKGQK